MSEAAQTTQSPAAVTAQVAAHVEQNHSHTDIGGSYRQHQVPVPGGSMTVGVWGPEDPAAPTILAVHGVSASHRSFGLLAEALPEVRVIAPDLRGRGRSTLLPGPYGMSVHADDMAAVLGALSTGPVTVVGHSMGGFVAVVLAHRHRSLVNSAVLVDGGIPLDVPAELTPDQVVQAILGPMAERLAMRFTSVDQYRAFWLEHPALGDSWSDRSGTAELMEDYITYDLQPEGNLLRPATQYEAMAQDTAELQGGDSLLEALNELQVPTTLYWCRRGLLGEEPGLYNPQYLRDSTKQVPALARQLRTEEVPGTNHYTIVMAPAGAAAVARGVQDDLAQHRQ